eukprot:31497-Pelagococcus_subviridis.AAC.74
MSGPTRRAASLVARAYLASPTAVTTTAAGTWRSHVVPLAARARESTAFGGASTASRSSIRVDSIRSIDRSRLPRVLLPHWFPYDRVRVVNAVP